MTTLYYIDNDNQPQVADLSINDNDTGCHCERATFIIDRDTLREEIPAVTTSELSKTYPASDVDKMFDDILGV